MPETIHEILKRKSVAVRFERTIGLFGATTLGIGALMGAGIYVLVGLAAGEAGPSVWVSYLCCGILVIPSVLMFGELSRLIPASGGGYTYAYQALGSLAGFLTGWLLAWGSILACAMYALGFSYYLGSFLNPRIPPIVLQLTAVAVICSLTFLNCRGTQKSDQLQRLLTWGNLLILAILILSAVPASDTRRLVPLLFPNGTDGMAPAIALIYISFFGYQLIANNAEEVVDAKRTVPRAMMISLLVSLFFYVAVALVSVLVVDWQELSRSSAPLVEVASRSLGSLGWVVVGAGGILASAAALNSTLLSQGRQIYAMGKHRFLPTILGGLYEPTKTPQAALLAGGIVTAVLAALADLEFIAKLANFCFITSLLTVAWALRRVQTGNSPWRRSLPWVVITSNLLLLLTLDWISFALGLQILAVGGVVYFGYSRRREIRARIGMSLILAGDRKAFLQRGPAFLRRGPRILVPLANPNTQGAMIAISRSLLGPRGGEIVALSVVTANDQTDFYSALANAEDSVSILEDSLKGTQDPLISLRPVVRVSRDLARGIVDAAEEEGCNLIVMGYSGDDSLKSAELVDGLLGKSTTDIVLIKVKGDFPPKRIVVPLAGRDNMDLMVRLAGAVADRFGGETTFLSILPEDFSIDQRRRANKLIAEAIGRHAGRSLNRTAVLSSDTPLELIIEQSRDYDLLVVGTTRVGMLEQVMLGSFAAQLAEKSHCSVAVVRVIPQGKKAFTRWVAT